ncbi:MAG: hypothetical protein HY236_11960 [Acidobacteria bacterium]|nr:hypothetical protein [Acidobacteriota bacterium]
MAREKKLEAAVTLFAAIEAEQHEALRTIAFMEHRSLADVVRQAIAEFIARQPAASKRALLKHQAEVGTRLAAG